MEGSRKNRVFEFGEFHLNPHEFLLLRGQEKIPLSPRTFSLLVKLVENAGHLLSKETLMREVWAGAIVEEGNLNRTVSSLRKALGEKPNEDRFIQTIPRVGYRFIAEVKEWAEEPTEAEGPAERVPATEDQSRPEAKKSRWLIPTLAAAVVALMVIGYSTYSAYSTGRNPSRGSGFESSERAARGPIRLTDDPSDETHPRWTKDGRIRFFRTDANRQAASFVMNPDGTNQQAVKDFSSLMFGVWSPDGQKVVFAKPNDRRTLYLSNADGASEARLPFFWGNFDWSPDSKQIVFQTTVEPNNSEVFVYSLDTAQSRNLSNNLAFDADPSFAPDGRIAFVSSREGNNEIYMMNADGGGVKRLTNNPAEDSHPVFSPDGTAVAFTSDRSGENADVYVLVSLDGSDNAVRLTDWTSNETVEPGCWSPDGTRIAFYSDHGGKDDIYVMSADVSQPKPVLVEGERSAGFPSYSPDGKTILYQSQAADKSSELRLLDLATNRSTTITKLDVADASPVWSPSGEWIAFHNVVGANTEICIVKPDGTGLTNLTNHPAKDISPAWSPDSKQIVFASNRDGSTQMFQLYLMNADGSTPHRIYGGNGFSSAPSWSPNGKEIIFANDKEDNRTGNFEIFAIDAANPSAERRLTFRRRYDVSPVFSPDGRRIAFVSDADGNSEIYLMNADGSSLVRATRTSAEDLSPRWSRDGSRILFSSNRDGKFALYEMPTSSPSGSSSSSRPGR